MKKTLKLFGVFAACIPVAALTACGLKPAADPAATYQAFAEKYHTARKELLVGEAYFTSYNSVTISAKGAKGTLEQRTVTDADIETANGLVTKGAIWATQDSSTELGEEKESYDLSLEGYITNGGFYQKQTLSTAENTTEETTVEPFTAEDGTNIYAETLFFPTEEFIEEYCLAEELEVKCNKSNTQMQMSAPLNPLVFFSELNTVSSVLGDYEYDYDTSLTYTIRFDNAGNLLYTEMELYCKATAIAPQATEADDDQSVDGENSENGETENDSAATPAPIDSVTITAYSRVNIKDASTVRLPSQSQLESFKPQDTIPDETPDDKNNDGE